MAERMFSPREESPVRSPLKRNGTAKGQIEGLVHDVRVFLSASATAAKLLDMNLQSLRHPKKEEMQMLVKVIENGLKQSEQAMEDAVNNAPLPECSLLEAYRMLEKALNVKCLGNAVSPSQCAVENLAPGAGMQHVFDVSRLPAYPEEKMRIVMEEPPADADSIIVRFAPCLASGIAENFVSNSLRKGAGIFFVRFEKTAGNQITLTMSDDGEGMSRTILDSLRQGECVTDKVVDDETDGAPRHGFGVRNVCELVKRAGGTTEMYSVPMSDGTSPDDGPVEEASRKVHPFMHGTTFELVLPAEVPLKAEPLSYDTYQHSMIVAATGRIKEGERLSRRRMFRTVAAGAATAGGVIGLHFALTREKSTDPHEVVREIPSSPLTDIQTDSEGRLLSFTYKMMGVETGYRYGEKLPRSIRDVQVLPLPEGGSLAVIVPASINGIRISPMYLCTTTAGVWGHALTETVKTEDGMRSAFLCAARDGADEGVPYQPDLYPMEDALFNAPLHVEIERIIGGAQEPKRRYHAVSEKLYESAAFREMRPLLMSAARALPAQTQRGEGARFNVFSAHLLKCLNIALIRDEQPVMVGDPNELQTAILTGGRFIILDEPFVESLRRKPLHSQLTHMAFEHGNSICLPHVSQNEAENILPLT